MHVFTDTTNIIKLEEAKNDMKCRDIMFTSVSHEFRTPLNAIINSLSFVNGSFREL
jgi:signal transduction histidine kinase